MLKRAHCTFATVGRLSNLLPRNPVRHVEHRPSPYLFRHLTSPRYFAYAADQRQFRHSIGNGYVDGYGNIHDGLDGYCDGRVNRHSHLEALREYLRQCLSASDSISSVGGGVASWLSLSAEERARALMRARVRKRRKNMQRLRHAPKAGEGATREGGCDDESFHYRWEKGVDAEGEGVNNGGEEFKWLVEPVGLMENALAVELTYGMLPVPLVEFPAHGVKGDYENREELDGNADGENNKETAQNAEDLQVRSLLHHRATVRHHIAFLLQGNESVCFSDNEYNDGYDNDEGDNSVPTALSHCDLLLMLHASSSVRDLELTVRLYDYIRDLTLLEDVPDGFGLTSLREDRHVYTLAVHALRRDGGDGDPRVGQSCPSPSVAASVCADYAETVAIGRADINDEDPWVKGAVIRCLAAAGRSDEVEYALARGGRIGGDVLSDVLEMYRTLGDLDGAFRMLETYEQQFSIPL